MLYCDWRWWGLLLEWHFHFTWASVTRIIDSEIWAFLCTWWSHLEITGLWTPAGKTHVVPVNLLYIIMFKIRKIKPNSGLVRQKPKSFHSDCWWFSVEVLSETQIYFCVSINKFSVLRPLRYHRMEQQWCWNQILSVKQVLTHSPWCKSNSWWLSGYCSIQTYIKRNFEVLIFYQINIVISRR